jgi:hypothetical protein
MHVSGAAIHVRLAAAALAAFLAGSPPAHAAKDAADREAYQEIEYANAAKPGPRVIVLPGEIKSTNSTFLDAIHPNNIADFAELELTRANFNVLERQNLGPLLNEFTVAYEMGDPVMARKVLQKGKVATTRWMVKFDILRAEPVQQKQSGFNGRGLGDVAGALGSLAGISSRGLNAARDTTGTVDVKSGKQTWLVGLRYKILNAATTEQVATGYKEERMEVTASSSTAAGISSQNAAGGTLDSLVIRLVQKSVADIDARYK